MKFGTNKEFFVTFTISLITSSLVCISLTPYDVIRVTDKYAKINSVKPDKKDEKFDRMNNSSHIIHFKNEVWTPSLESFRVPQNEQLRHKELEPMKLNQLNLALFQNKNNTSPISSVSWNENTSLHQFLGFVRIPKCGSSSLNNLFHQEMNQLHIVAPNLRSAMDACIYSRFPDELSNMNRTTPDKIVCAHIDYPTLFHHFVTKSIQRLKPTNESDVVMTFEGISIVRDPFDMMYSLFNYIRGGVWRKFLSKVQMHRLRDNDFEGWLEHELLVESSTDWWSQYKFFHLDDVNEAITYIQGDVPRVFLLITECFDTSLKLLAERKPHFISRKGVDAFLHSKLATANADASKSKMKKDANVTHISEYDLEILRHKSKPWLADEYRFYNAAKEQFIHHLLSSNLEQSEIESCIKKLVT